MKTIFCDIDHTIWDLYDDLKVVAKDLYDFDLEREHIDQWNWCYKLFGSDGFKIFTKVLVPEKVSGRELYSGVPEAMRKLYDMGYNIYFLSHHWNATDMEPAVREWLNAKLDIPFTVKLIQAKNSKIDYMLQDRTAVSIIEDKPKTLKEAVDYGIVPLAKLQKFNMDVVEKENILSFVEWNEVPDLVKYTRLPSVQEKLFA